MAIPLWVANTLRGHGSRFNVLTKLLIYLPNVTCSVALVIVWNFLFWPNLGLFSQMLARFGVVDFSFLTVPIFLSP